MAKSVSAVLVGLRQVRRRVSLDLRGLTPAFVIRVVLRLMALPNVPRWFVYELVNHNRDVIRALTPAHIEKLGDGISSWGEVDAFACYVAGPAWREGRLTSADVERWAKSSDRWWRRAALVSTVPLNNMARGGTGDAQTTLFVCDLLRHDRDDMVIKALSWALRELAKREPRISR